MLFPLPLVPGRLVRRYKRFLADCLLDSGEAVTAHVANSGSMLGLATPGARVYLAGSSNPKRKLAWSWQLVEANGALVGIDTGLSNRIVAEAIAAGRVPALAGYRTLRREVVYGVNSRVDMLLEGEGRPPCYVEVKSVTLSRRPGIAEFPDAVTARGAKHLAELAVMVGAGARAVLVYLVQRGDCDRFQLAADIDPIYAAAAETARLAGVEMLVVRAEVTPAGIEIRSDF
ncbi:DNA/RNA nuclease SfsA [Pleomorphomonas diazotrophica]|uniref:Sugar fermentation stimulation protein homolog n=1 Tax=Pleomorphomonas diazotrophica TaxID=1166257 RepID=A0A1I4R2F0_9HYPH|nr:DNA/RNA nuclease SfsA [Pleomorphomonas diazotrophica]PKR90251.1 DNA/RNA nuclease SfsA [Pleomorphomonas diazotrophica]SFM46439.1 sugar fermentation stimulation protein A [Pleomorphomonas diazotrophica]